MPVHDRPAREVLRLPAQADGPTPPPWAEFDPEWYRMRYSDAPAGSDEELLAWHFTQGQRHGHSPNRYFDEEWQRRTWPGIVALIEAGSIDSAFDAWCRGAHTFRPAHWLFSPREYRDRYPALTDEVLAESGFVNRYHHYLRFGAAEGRIGHRLFDPAIYLASLEGEPDIAGSMPFRHYLQGLENGAPERRTSHLFDPDWYRERYKEAARAVEAGEYRSLLEHYLRNDRPTEFDPSPRFSEEHYLAENAGVADSIGPEGFRNGFAHFLAHGLREGRSPHPDLDLAWYAGRDEVRAAIESNQARDAFTHWITTGHPAGTPGRPRPEVVVTEAHALALHQRRARTIWPSYGRHKLDFSHSGTAPVSVIMALREHCVDTMVSLASLRSQYRGGIELILIDSDLAPHGEDIETYVTGATVLRFGTVLNDTAARAAGLICATADAILFLGDGIELAPDALDAALARLAGDQAVGVIGGRIVQPHGVLLEAGGIIWRDGRLQAYARDASPSAAEANFVRDTDFCSTLFLLARRDVLSSLPDQANGLVGTSHDGADLCVRVQQAGFRVVYDPNALAFLTTHPAEGIADGRAAFVAAHGEYLATRPEFDPTAMVSARAPWRGQTRVLFIEDSIPLRRIGSGFVRSNDVLHAMAASGAWVTVFPMKANLLPLSTVRAELPDTIEAMHEETVAGLAGFLAARRNCYDIIWVARTHNLDQIHALLADYTEGAAEVAPDPVPRMAEWTTQSTLFRRQTFDLHAAPKEGFSLYDALSVIPSDRATGSDRSPAEVSGRGGKSRKIIVDTEAIASPRRAGQAALLGQEFDLGAAVREEFRNLAPAMDVVAVSEAEAGIVRAHHRGNVAVLGHALRVAPTPRSFEERTGLLFVGAIHGMDHPNHDGLAWFVDEVLPLIERVLHWETRLTVAGYTVPDVTLDRFKGHPRVTLRGAVTDLVPLYDANRVFIAPTRFAAGLPYKVHEAAAFGLPVVATSLLACQLGWPDGEAIGGADISDPAGFAARVIALHRDKVLWTRLRDAALTRVASELDPDRFASQVAALAQLHPIVGNSGTKGSYTTEGSTSPSPTIVSGIGPIETQSGSAVPPDTSN